MPGKDKTDGHASSGQLSQVLKLPRKLYETELCRLQGELVKMQGWIAQRVPGSW